LAFTIIELIGGFFTNSVAILSDAVHDMGDSVSLGMAWYFQGLSKKQPTQKYSYGYRRFNVLGALINALILLVGACFIIHEAIHRLYSPEAVKVEGMLLMGLLGVGFNGYAIWGLRKEKASHIKVVALHLLEDVLGWVAVLIGAILMYFFTLPWLDAALSIGISLYVLFNALRFFASSLKIMLQASPKAVNLGVLQEQLLKVKGVLSVHDMHAWSLDDQYAIVTAHVVVNAQSGLEDICHVRAKAREVLLTNEVLRHATVEVELEGEQCQNCGINDPIDAPHAHHHHHHH